MKCIYIKLFWKSGWNKISRHFVTSSYFCLHFGQKIDSGELSYQKIDALIKQYCINFWENKWTSGWLKLNYEPQCTDLCAIHPITIIQCFIIDVCKSAISPYTFTIRLVQKIDWSKNWLFGPSASNWSGKTKKNQL